MMSDIGEKRTFLAVYDYGQGGIWVLINARTEEEIRRAYPELVVVQDRPDWMTDNDYAWTSEKMSFDIDDAPSGWLATLMEERRKAQNKSNV